MNTAAIEAQFGTLYTTLKTCREMIRGLPMDTDARRGFSNRLAMIRDESYTVTVPQDAAAISRSTKWSHNLGVAKPEAFEVAYQRLSLLNGQANALLADVMGEHCGRNE